MYCKYAYNAGATKSNVLNDIVSVITGETVLQNLSGSCNKDDSELFTSKAIPYLPCVMGDTVEYDSKTLIAFPIDAYMPWDTRRGMWVPKG